jgi:hypothetical protein
MTRRTKTLALATLVACGVGLGGAAVRAGYKIENDVNVTTSPTFRSGSGSVGTARASADGNEQIGCSVESTIGGVFARCKARTAAGVYLECTSGAAPIVQAAAAIGSASRLYFTENLMGGCTGLQVDNESNWKPMVP